MSETNNQRKKIRVEFEKFLKKMGYRLTKQRLIVLDAIINAGAHVNTEEIADKAKQLDKTIGIATVYRTLQLMREAGFVEGSNNNKEAQKYEVKSIDGTHHDHLICQKCGTVIEFYSAEIEKLQEKIAKELGFVLYSHKMELIGECINSEECQKNHQRAKQKKTFISF